VLYFNFKERPDEMCDKIVDIKVLDAKRFIQDALIGSFKVASFHSCIVGFPFPPAHIPLYHFLSEFYSILFF